MQLFRVCLLPLLPRAGQLLPVYQQWLGWLKNRWLSYNEFHLTLLLLSVKREVLSIVNGIWILVKEAFSSISLSSKLLHQSTEERPHEKDKNERTDAVLIVRSDDETATARKEKKADKKEKKINSTRTPEPLTEKPVAMASSSSGGDSIKTEKVLEMMEKMMQVLEAKKNEQNKEASASTSAGSSLSAGDPVPVPVPPPLEPVEGDLHPVMWLDCNWQLSVGLSFGSVWLSSEMWQ